MWLRPENALWRALNCKALEDVTFSSPSLELSCGDGVFSFLLAGGNFDTSFDIFKGAGDLDNFYDNADIYDAAPSDYDPAIAARPDRTIDVGCDWKPNLLEKADSLGLYDELTEHDNNEPLPFDDDKFRTIYSNSVYWIENVDLHLSEIKRVLADDGKAILQLKTPAIRDFLNLLRNSYTDELGENLIDTIDRGRSDHYAHVYHDEGWTERLEDAGLQVVDRRPTATWVHTRMWDIGLRPISPLMIKMANSLSDEQRVMIKEEWIDTWEQMLRPFYDLDFDLNQSRKPPEIIYIVEPDQ
jgi:SAM-dependent methyltransferase